MGEIKLVIFDCDGVLMDSESIATEAELSIYRQYGLKIDAEEFSTRFAGSASNEIMKELEKELELPISASVLDDIVAAVDEQCGKNAPMVKDADKVLEMIDQARCICSNSPRNRLEAMLRRVGLFDRFRPYIYSSSDFNPPANKPKPDVFLKALGEFNVSANEAVVVEDSVHGVAGGIAAGIRVIGFTGGSHSYMGHSDALISAGADTSIRRLIELPSVLEAFGQWDGLPS